MPNLTEQRRAGITMLVAGLLVLAGAAVIFFTMAEPFPMWLILLAIGATFTSVGAGMWMQER